MSLAADSFKPPCLLGYYPCISNPSSKDCAIIDIAPRTCIFASLQSWRLLMELIFRVSGTVFLIGIVRMGAARVLGGELLSVGVFEVGNDDSKRR